MKYKVICLLTFLGLINYTIVYAYFLTDNHSNGLRIDPRLNQHSSTNDTSFYLYDNYFYIHENSFLTRKINGFIPVDQIQINMPLKILSRTLIYPADSVDRLLLANLRIKDLVSEYSALQKKSQSIFNDNPVAGTGGRRSINSAVKEKNRLESIEYEKEKINKKIININRLSSVSQEDGLSEKALSVILDGDAENRQISTLNMTADPKDSSRIAQRALDLEKKDIDMGRQILVRKENSELPWIFNLFLKILNYMLMNRLEVILYIIFAAVAGYFISLQIRR